MGSSTNFWAIVSTDKFGDKKLENLSPLQSGHQISLDKNEIIKNRDTTSSPYKIYNRHSPAFTWKLEFVTHIFTSTYFWDVFELLTMWIFFHNCLNKSWNISNHDFPIYIVVHLQKSVYVWHKISLQFFLLFFFLNLNCVYLRIDNSELFLRNLGYLIYAALMTKLNLLVTIAFIISVRTRIVIR